QQILVDQVHVALGYAHRAVTHRTLHEVDRLTLLQPRGHPPVAEVVLVQVRRELRTLPGRAERAAERGDPLARLRVPLRELVVEEPRGPLALLAVRAESIRGHVVAQRFAQSRGDRDAATLPTLRPSTLPNALDREQTLLHVDVLPAQPQRLRLAADAA